MGTTTEHCFWSTPHRVVFFRVALLMAVAGCGSNAPVAKKASPARPRPAVPAPAEVLEPGEVDGTSIDGKPTPEVHPESLEPKVPIGPRRPPDTRLIPDEDAVALRGIRRYESKRLRLYSDVPADRVARLPALVDALYDDLERYFGPLPPDDAGSDFQMTGYVMADPARFEASGVVPVDLPPIRHGRHRGAEFWMKDQSSDYYLAHLLLHEATHCFMTITPNPLASQPWYIEGMAELFATHQPGPPARFGVMPDAREKFPDLGRIALIREAVSAGTPLNAQQVFQFQGDDYLTNPPYAWSWALCWYMANLPETQELFRALEDNIDPENPHDSFLTQFAKQQFNIAQGFWLFTHDICHGYDLDRAAIAFRRGLKLGDKPETVTIRADRGWQSSLVLVEQDRRYQITASGRYVVGRSTKAWESEPDGVTLRYVEGQPLGRLLGTIREELPGEVVENLSMRAVSAFGKDVEWTAPATGTLYLRVNDAWNSLADNEGELTVTMTALP